MRARWLRSGFLNCNNRPRCLNRIHFAFQPCARSPAPYRLPGSGRCRSWWARDGPVWEEGSARWVLAPSPSLCRKKTGGTKWTEREVVVFLAGENSQQGQTEPKVIAGSVSIAVQNPACPRCLWQASFRGLDPLCRLCWKFDGRLERCDALSSSQRVKTLRLTAPSSSIPLHLSLAGIRMTDWMLMGVGPRFGTITKISHNHRGREIVIYAYGKMWCF